MPRVRTVLSALPALAFAFPVAVYAASFGGAFAQRSGHIGDNVSYLPQVVSQVGGASVRSTAVESALAGESYQRAGHIGGNVAPLPQQVSHDVDPDIAKLSPCALGGCYAQRAGHIGGNAAPVRNLASSGNAPTPEASTANAGTHRTAA